MVLQCRVYSTLGGYDSPEAKLRIPDSFYGTASMRAGWAASLSIGTGWVTF